MYRRWFLGLAAAPRSLATIPVRKTGKVEIAFKPPGPRPNGLQATPEGLWILDAGNNRVYLVQFEDGKILREFDTDSQQGSGITYSSDGVWIASTQNRTIYCADPLTGKTLQAHFTPGAGVQYRMPGDPPNRRSPLDPPAGQGRGAGGGGRGGTGAGQIAGPSRNGTTDLTLGTGANGLEFRDGKIYMAVPPSRSIYCVDAKTWIVQQRFDTAGNRTHGLGWEGRWLWNVDSNLNGFFKHDPDSGEIVERIQLDDKDPLPHGMTIRQDTLWYCDEAGVVCRLKIA